MKIPGSNGRASSIPAGLALAAAVSLGITGAGSVVTAWLVLRGSFPPGWAGYCAMVILLLGSITGAATAVSRIRRLRMQMSLAAGAIYYLCLVSITALFFGGRYQGLGVTGLIIFCGSGLVILLGPGGKNVGDRRRRKIRKLYFGNFA